MTPLLKLLSKLKHDQDSSIFETEQKILELFSNLDSIPTEKELDEYVSEITVPLEKFQISNDLTAILLRSGARWAIREMRKKAMIPKINDQAG